MAGIFNFIDNYFSKSKKDNSPRPLPSYLLKSKDFQDITNYFLEVIKFYTSVQHTIEGFNREQNRPNWVVAMCEDLYEKINYFRTNTSKKNISIKQVFEKEELATSEREYSIKLALFCSELCLN